MNDWVKKWTRRLGGAGMALLLAALAACGAARAQEDAAQTGNEAQIEYQYGPWSEWSLEAVEPAGDIEVQTRQARELTMKTVYAYSRFAYQGEAGMQYAPCEVEGVEGQWQSETVDQPKAVSGEADGIIRYEGDWFNQSEGQAIAQEKRARGRPDRAGGADRRRGSRARRYRGGHAADRHRRRNLRAAPLRYRRIYGLRAG